MKKVEEAMTILQALGLPKGQQNERSALTLLTLLSLRKRSRWSSSTGRPVRIHEILIFIRDEYGKRYAENTRETIRRQTLHQFEQAGLVVRNPDNPRRPTNSPKTVYAIADDALKLVRKFRTRTWQPALRRFAANKGRLIDRYEKRKRKYLVAVDLPDGTLLSLSPGKHNRLQARIIEEFLGRFCPSAKVVYVGDTARKLLHLKRKLARNLGIPITEHDKLPDVVLYDRQRNLLYLIEAVTAHGPISPKRQIELEETLEKCKAKRVYISAFPDSREFKKHIDNIAWETEVWIEANPDHIIHFNGPRFLTVYGK